MRIIIKAWRTTALTILLGLSIISCNNNKREKAIGLYHSHCATCHLLPAIENLPKSVWENGVLPDMAARMGLIDSSNNPYQGLTFKEEYAVRKSGIYNVRPQMSVDDWKLLQNYIITMAPESLVVATENKPSHKLHQFTAKPISFDKAPGSFISYLAFDSIGHTIRSANLEGIISEYAINTQANKTLLSTGKTITSFTQTDTLNYLTQVGNLNPSEVASGAIVINSDSVFETIPIELHRPVHTTVHDFNGNGRKELVVSEFGNLTGALSLLVQDHKGDYRKKILLHQPGTIRTIVNDMNADGRADIIALTSQGREGITVLFNQDSLNFTAETVLQFSAVYGTSWFELLDFNNDGFQDLITVNGDNADKSYVHKPYHGLRIHINDGHNKFKETYFYPMNGATRFVARDFDKDGDVDFGIISTFPDYQRKPEYAFVYLENMNTEKYQFQPSTLQEAKLGRWFLIDAGDVDHDGDDDIILSSFTYSFTPVPKTNRDIWKKANADLLILENELLTNSNVSAE